jgi:hypothetical protein
MNATDDIFARRFAWPDLRGQRTLAIGLGGGSDAITAYAIAHLLDADVAYGNTKHELDADLVQISPRIARLDERAVVRGKTKIERRLPRGPLGSPLVFALPRDEAPDALARELAALAFDLVIGVDTGGDVLDGSTHGSRGRDRRMLDVIRQLDVPALLVVVALGADGQQPRDWLEMAMEAEVAAGRYRGAFSLEPLLVPRSRSLARVGQTSGPAARAATPARN